MPAVDQRRHQVRCHPSLTCRWIPQCHLRWLHLTTIGILWAQLRRHIVSDVLFGSYLVH